MGSRVQACTPLLGVYAAAANPMSIDGAFVRFHNDGRLGFRTTATNPYNAIERKPAIRPRGRGEPGELQLDTVTEPGLAYRISYILNCGDGRLALAPCFPK